MDLDTLESRLHILIKSLPFSNHNQQLPQLLNSSSSSIGTMIPTPGMSHGVNSNLMVTSSADASMIAASGCNSITPSSVNTGSMLPSGSVGIHSGSFTSADGISCFL